MTSLTFRRTAHRAGALSLALGAAVAISGCYGITGSSLVAQHDVTGDAEVRTDFCLNGVGQNSPPYEVSSSDEDGCTLSDSGNPGSSYQVQTFVSYLVKDGTADPVISAKTGQFADTTFTKVTGADADALAGSSVPEGQHWVSFASGPLTSTPTGTALTASLTASIDTSEVDGGFDLPTKTAWRWLNGTSGFELTRAVACGQPTSGGSFTPATACDYDSRTPGFPVNYFRWSRAAEDYPTELTAGTTLTSQWPFVSGTADEDDSISIPLAASTTIPGGVVHAPSSLALGAQEPLEVEVDVPDSTPTGTYTYSLSAGSGTGLRTVTESIHVTALPADDEDDAGEPDPTPTPEPVYTPEPTPTAGPVPTTVVPTPTPTPTPAPAPKSVPQKLATAATSFVKTLTDDKHTEALRKGKVTFPIELPTAGTIRLSVTTIPNKKRKTLVLATGVAQSGAAGFVNIALKRTPEGRAALAADKDVKAILVVRLWNKDGKTTTTSEPFTLTAGD